MILTDSEYVSKAEKVILALIKRKEEENKKKNKKGAVKIVTTSKLRNILSMSADIYNMANLSVTENLDDSINAKIEYLKVRILYEAGRDKDVKELVEKAQLLGCIDEIKGSKKNFIRFNRYLEAIVAYRKYYVEYDD